MANSSKQSMWSPSEWQTASDFYGKMISPSAYQDLWNAQSKNINTQWSNQAKQLAEGYTRGGVGSSALGRNIAQVGSQMYDSMYPQFLSQMLNNQMNAASGLTNVGSLSAELPLQVSSAMGNIGSQQTNQQVNPYLSMLSSLLGSSTTPTMYQPSTMTNILGSLSSVPWSSIFGGSSGTSANAQATALANALATTPSYNWSGMGSTTPTNAYSSSKWG